jgi:hypothetical protein
MKRQIVLAMLSTALFGWSCPGYAQTSWTVRPIAVIGDATPGGGTFAKFEDRPNINEAGDVVFIATIAMLPCACRAPGSTASRAGSWSRT